MMKTEGVTHAVKQILSLNLLLDYKAFTAIYWVECVALI